MYYKMYFSLGAPTFCSIELEFQLSFRKKQVKTQLCKQLLHFADSKTES